MAIIEAKRVELHLHKATLCSKADISTMHYNRLLAGINQPSWPVVKALIVAVNLRLLVVEGSFCEL